MTKNKWDQLWDQHLLGCNTCNYDEQCMACEVGEPYSQHACNCKHGTPDNGYHLQQKTSYGQRATRMRALSAALNQRDKLRHEVVSDIEYDDHDLFDLSLRELVALAIQKLLGKPETRARVVYWAELEENLDKLNRGSRKVRIWWTDRDNGEPPF